MKRFIYLTVFVSLLSLLSGCSKIFSSNDNLQKPSPLPVVKPSITVEEVWSTRPTVGTMGNYLKLGPTIVGDVLYTADTTGRLVALNKHTGKRLWKYDSDTNITTTPAASADRVAVGTGYAQVITAQPADGKLAWFDRVSTEILAQPTLTSRVLLIKTVDGHVYAFNAKTGDRLWTYDHGAPGLILRASSSPQVKKGTVVVGFADGKVDAISLRSGKLLWQTRIATPAGSTAVEQMVDIDANPVIVGNRVYVVSFQGNLVALDLNDGHAFWHHQLSAFTGLSVARDRLFVSDAHSDLYAFSQRGGGILWKQTQLQARKVTAPTVMKNTIVVGDAQGYLHWLAQSDGHFVAQQRASRSAIMAAPVVSDDMLYVTSARGEVVAYRIRANS